MQMAIRETTEPQSNCNKESDTHVQESPYRWFLVYVQRMSVAAVEQFDQTSVNNINVVPHEQKTSKQVGVPFLLWDTV